MNRRPCLTILAAALLSANATFLVAGPIADKAAEIEAAMASGDHAAAWAGVGSLSDEAWNAAPQIGFSTIGLTIERSVDYGVYNPRPDNKFKAESPVIIYTEPWGYGFGSAGEGLHSINFAVDLEVLNGAGETLGSLKDIAKIDFISRNRRKETNATVIFNLGGIAPGAYLLKVTFRDMNSTKSGTFDLPIEIVQ
jgi:hypothetical protein